MLQQAVLPCLLVSQYLSMVGLVLWLISDRHALLWVVLGKSLGHTAVGGGPITG
jgi:flagellar biosynthesis protein FliR